MKLSILQNELQSQLQLVSKAVSPISPQASLRCIKIEAKNDSIILTGSDADISIQKTIKKNNENQLNIIEEGTILVDVKYLLELVRRVDSEIIEIEILDGTLLYFHGGKAKFKINGLNPNNYPNIDFSLNDNSFSLKTSDLLDIINQTVFAVSKKDTRPILTGVNIKTQNNTLNCTATDSFRLSRKILPFDSNIEFNVTIPSKVLNELKSSLQNLDKNSDILISINDKKAQFVFDDTVFQARLLDGEFPATDKLIPTEGQFNYYLDINKRDLMSAVDRSIFIKNENIITNKLDCSKDEIILSNRNQEVGEFEEELAGKFEGEDLEIVFIAYYMLDALRALNGDEVRIKFTEKMRAFIVSDPSDDSITELVLPTRHLS